MTWQNRTRTTAYTSPKGTRFEFVNTTTNRSFDKQTSAFNFPGVPGTYIQDLGNTDRHYPMRATFWGDNHDLEAAAFENALRETGRGRLDHARDGRVSVVPFGKVTSREDLVNDANQTIIEVEFWESTITLYPSGTADPKAQVLDSIGLTLVESSSTFADNIEIASAVDRASIRNRFDASIGSVRQVLGEVVSADPVQLREFNVVADSIVSDLDTLIDDPATLADQLNVLLQIPANSTATIGSKFDGYTATIDQFTSANNPDGQLRATVNDFRNDELFAVGCLSSLMTSSVEATFTTRSEAVTAAASVDDQFIIVNEWRELNYAGLA